MSAALRTDEQPLLQKNHAQNACGAFHTSEGSYRTHSKRHRPQAALHPVRADAIAP